MDTGKLIEPFSITAAKLYRIEEWEMKDKVMNSEIGERVEVYWPNEKKYFSGTIDKYGGKSNKHTINYDDGDVEILDFTKEKWPSLTNSTNFTALLGTLSELVPNPPKYAKQLSVIC